MSRPSALRAALTGEAGRRVVVRPAGPWAALVLGCVVLWATLAAPASALVADRGPGPGSGEGDRDRGPATSRSASRAEPGEPLEVSLTSLSPAVVPRRGPVRVRGTVTNRSEEEWTTVNLHAFRSSSPITDPVSLTAAAATDPAEPVGTRITAPGTFDTVASLLPGETTTFSLTVPREALGISGAPGVYWFGVHALGDSSEPRDGIADGRARTFLPLVEPGRQQVRSAVVVPVRGTVRHRPDGRLARPAAWTKALTPGGRLHELLDVDARSQGTTLTWLLDPAIPEAVAHLARGNPPRDLAADPDPAPQDDEDADGSEDPGGEGTDQDAVEPDGDSPATPGPQPEELTAQQRELADLAAGWLAELEETLSGATVLTLPYGDLDVDAAADHGPEWLERAAQRSAEVMDGLGIEATPVVAARDGVLSADAVRSAGPDATVLLSDTAFVTPPSAPRSLLRLLGHEVVLTSTGASSGGPGPGRADAPLALRQRILSEAALRLVDGSRTPLVTMLPHDWRPEDASALFEGLAQAWLDSVPVTDLEQGRATPVSSETLAYTEQDAAAELDAAHFAEADDLLAAARLLDEVLTDPSVLPRTVTDETLTALSYAHRDHPQEVLRRIRAATERLEGLLGSIRIDVPPSVTLSSRSGSLGATVINDLDEPVTIGIDAVSGGSLELRDPELLRLAPDSRTRILLDVTANRLGVHDVRLVVTGPDGEPLGSSVELPIRAAQVSQVIWVIIAIGAALLFGAIALRIVRRVRDTGATTTAPGRSGGPA